MEIIVLMDIQTNSLAIFPIDTKYRINKNNLNGEFLYKLINYMITSSYKLFNIKI